MTISQFFKQYPRLPFLRLGLSVRCFQKSRFLRKPVSRSPCVWKGKPSDYRSAKSDGRILQASARTQEVVCKISGRLYVKKINSWSYSHAFHAGRLQNLSAKPVKNFQPVQHLRIARDAKHVCIVVLTGQRCEFFVPADSRTNALMFVSRNRYTVGTAA